jgi:uncharacterized lipoprotein YehR (DUF1307 family)
MFTMKQIISVLVLIVVVLSSCDDSAKTKRVVKDVDGVMYTVKVDTSFQVGEMIWVNNTLYTIVR